MDNFRGSSSFTIISTNVTTLPSIRKLVLEFQVDKINKTWKEGRGDGRHRKLPDWFLSCKNILSVSSWKFERNFIRKRRRASHSKNLLLIVWIMNSNVFYNEYITIIIGNSYMKVSCLPQLISQILEYLPIILHNRLKYTSFVYKAWKITGWKKMHSVEKHHTLYLKFWYSLQSNPSKLISTFVWN